jgi:hypothetical protein
MSASEAGAGAAGAPSEEELRAAYEAELKRLRVEHVLIEHVVTLVNLGMRRTGLGPGTEDERDPGQVRLAIESIRALMPVLEQTAPQQIGQIKSALSQLQLAFVRIGGTPAGQAGGGETGGASGAGGGGGGGAGGPGGGGGPGGPGGGGPGGPGGGGPGGGGPGGGGAGGPGGTGQPAPERPRPGEPGPAQRSGRLWVPGQ